MAFLAVVFFALDFLAALFFALDFLAALFLRDRFLAGPLARRTCNRSEARSMVISSGFSSLGMVALYSPSVTYGPKRPS